MRENLIFVVVLAICIFLCKTVSAEEVIVDSTFSKVEQVHVFGDDESRSIFGKKVIGPNTLKVGQIGYYCVTDNGQLVFRPESSCPNGCYTVSGPNSEFVEASDENGLGFFIKFLEKGEYLILFKVENINQKKILVK